jgi:malate synthase
MTVHQEIGRLKVEAELRAFVRDEALAGTGIAEQDFWSGAERLFDEFGPKVRAALALRERLQRQLDDFHAGRPGVVGSGEYAEMLRSIGYLVDPPDAFEISTSGVDPEISTMCGPQLVVPALNARFAINAANARWGSLYDALYGSDVIAETNGRERGGAYNTTRGAAVVMMVRDLLDEFCPLQRGSHRDVAAYAIGEEGLRARRSDGEVTLAEPAQLAGYQGPRAAPTAILLVHHGLHLDVRVDRDDPVGRADPAGVADVVIEAALTTIVDLEDSVAAVDASDKVVGYRNWLELLQGTLTAQVTKGAETFTRRLNRERRYRTLSGEDVVLRGTSLLLVRNVGHLMTTDAVLDASDAPVSEGILDALVTSLCGKPREAGAVAGGLSPTPSIYIVKPKLHGPDEVALTCAIFGRVEEVLGLPARTIKIGIMDEERRTSLNLAACIRQAHDRVAFINTGFLDRTGDEIRSSTYAGPMARKADMRSEPWIAAYEAQNVAVGLACGFGGKAQIGKGMWAAPDNLAEMLATKIAHPRAGATTAWVPSPTAATLHAIHYHRVDVWQRQAELASEPPRSRLPELLTVPLGDPSAWGDAERRHELDSNVQSTLGYVVRWIEMGVGCSKVPDIDGTPLMEDRATCRISSQIVANWLLHGVVDRADVEDSLRRMARYVDEQNADDPLYRPMSPDFDGHAFAAARRLLTDGISQPNGYTEPILHSERAAEKTASKGMDK